MRRNEFYDVKLTNTQHTHKDQAKEGGLFVQGALEGYSPRREPWSNESLRGSHLFEEYCRRPEVVAELGADFALEQDAAEEQRDKRRRH